MEFVVQSVRSDGTKEPATLEEIPDLRFMYQWENPGRLRVQVTESTDHDTERPHVDFGIPACPHDDLRCSVDPWHNVPGVLLVGIA